ncbi:MAG: glucose-6-phosphate dehydrogenase [Candidatus Doudnabacteria bacterium]
MAIRKSIKEPTVLVIFGATGDLVERKLLPALYHLYLEKQLPAKFRVIGFARRPFSDEQFRQLLKKSLRKKVKIQGNIGPFLRLFSYHQGMFDQKDAFQSLVGKLKGAGNKLFYLATPPIFYDGLLRELAKSGLTRAKSGLWARIIVEKPFGKDLRHAEELDLLLGKLFTDDQIYRIDHYLAKDILQDIMAFRFANNLLENVWNHNFIEKIEIRTLEEIDVESRGEFYDATGALVDMGQNHLLQMMALITMDNPNSPDPHIIRSKRAEVIGHLRLLGENEIKNQTLRGQYQGYKKEPGVSRTSNTETYFKLLAHINSPRWQNVPIYLEAGKNLHETKKEIVVTLKGVEFKNRIIFRIQPNPGIEIEFWNKQGQDMVLEKRQLRFDYESESKLRYVAEYRKLIRDAMEGDQTLFVSSREAIASWRFIDPIIADWKKKSTPLAVYKKNTKILQMFDQLPKPHFAHKKFAMIGLGKMGKNLAIQLLEKNWQIIATNQHSKQAIEELSRFKNFKPVNNWKELAASLPRPRLFWLMVPHAEVDAVLFSRDGLADYLERGDIVIDSGNSFYKDSIRRGGLLAKKGIDFMDVGFSGGPGGALRGGCLMIGGKENLFEKLRPLFDAMSIPDGYKYFGKAGAGHFVKMVHNGIEYGMMQSIAEGFGIMKASPFKLNLIDVADIYNHGSVVESRLVGWLKDAFLARGQNLKGISGVVGYTGEGEWTAKTAKELGIPAAIIEQSFRFRVRSKKTKSFVGKLVSSMREQFGGHSVK